jgi:hypothetical protein
MSDREFVLFSEEGSHPGTNRFVSQAGVPHPFRFLGKNLDQGFIEFAPDKHVAHERMTDLFGNFHRLPFSF